MSNPDDDPAFDIDPDKDLAAYEEWEALAGEPARAPPEHPQRDFADGRASFDAIAASLTQAQVKAASHPGSILVLAGAGTGKTSTLTAAVAHRIALDGVPPHRVLAVTFTNKAAGEMAGKSTPLSVLTPPRTGSAPFTAWRPVSCAPVLKSHRCATISTSSTPTIPDASSAGS